MHRYFKLAMKIVLRRNKCISCGSCAAICGDFFEMADDNFPHLKGSTKEGEDEILEVEESKIGCAKETAEVCPVQIIEIV